MRFRNIILSAALTMCTVSVVPAAELSTAAVVVPNEGLNAVIEINPDTGTVYQMIPIPAPYTLQSGARMQWSVLIGATYRIGAL
jgi:hypothetical protein